MVDEKIVAELMNIMFEIEFSHGAGHMTSNIFIV